jgi:hypothetical protein
MIGMDDHDQLPGSHPYFENVAVAAPMVRDEMEHTLLPHIPDVLETV